MEEDLGVALDALVELVVGQRGLVERHVVRDYEGRLGAAGDDQVTQVAVVFLQDKQCISGLR